jgi:hypothetical protein
MQTFEEYISNMEEDQFGRYLEFKAHQDGLSIQEAAVRSMARLYGQISQPQFQLVVITAFRGDRELTINRKVNVSLASDIRANGWGYTPVLGGFMEDAKDAEGNPAKRRVHEESFFVSASGDTKQVAAKVASLLKKYQQDAALFKPAGSEEAFLLFPNGTMSSAGAWHNDPKQMATYYTRMKKGHSGRQFTFEAARDDSNMTRMAVDNYFKKK